jgi:hypothetical protein
MEESVLTSETMHDQMDKAMQQEDSKGQKVQPCQRFWQTLVVAWQASEACGPSETAFDDPTTLPPTVIFCL